MSSNGSWVRVPLTERELVQRVTDLLVSQGYRVRHEVPNMGQSADIVATKPGLLMFVEAKVRDWRRALSQCVAHEQVADFICIALGTNSVSEEALSQVAARGYGLISFSLGERSCAWVHTPRRNEKVWSPQRRRAVSLMRNIEYAR